MSRKGGGFKVQVGLQADGALDELFFIGLKGVHRWHEQRVNGSGTGHADYYYEEYRWLGFFLHEGVLKFGWRAEIKNEAGVVQSHAGSMEAVPNIVVPAYDEGNTATNADRLNHSRPLLKKVELSMTVIPESGWYYLMPYSGDTVAAFYANGVRLVESSPFAFWGSQYRYYQTSFSNGSTKYFEFDNCIWEEGLVFECLTASEGGNVAAESTQVEIYDALAYYD